jgi:SAM-dependent methyltransferase
MRKDPVHYKAHTISGYDAVANTLAQAFDSHFANWAHEEAAYFLTMLQPKDRILDLGCGGGPASRYFSSHGYHVVSGDLSTSMLHECQRRGLSALVRLDLEALPFRPHTFEAIWAHTSLLHIPKARFTTALQSCMSILVPHGTFFIALREGQGESYVNIEGQDMWFSRFRSDEFKRYFPEGIELLRHTRTQPGRGAFLNYLLRKM